MKVVELYGRVRYAVQIEGLSRREAARQFGIDPRTVAKMLGVRPALQDQRRQLGGAGADRRRIDANSLDRALGDARVELLTDQPMRHRVVMPVDIDVVVEPDPAYPPLGLGRQLLQCRTVQLEEQVAPADEGVTQSRRKSKFGGHC
jgi:hypothetical protein